LLSNIPQIDHAIHRKHGDNTYQKIMSIPNIPACRILEGLKFAPIFDIFLKDVKTIAQDFLNICSKTGEIKAMNVSCSGSEFVSRFPDGEYRVELRLFDEQDDNIVNTTLYSHLFH
jgi:hypothetical protein